MRSTMGRKSRWSPPPQRLTLAGDEVHVWRACLDVPESRVRALEENLVEDEVNRAHRFYFAKDRWHFTVARGLLREILSLYLDTPPNQLCIGYNPHGKPFLSETTICFNLSHSGGMALYAIARSMEIGIDLERVRTDFECVEVAEGFFSRCENDALRAVRSDLQHVAFFNCWTRKEAFVKLHGEGMSFPLKQFDVTLAPNEPARLISIIGDSRAAAQYCIQELDVGDGYAAALVVEGSSCQIGCWQWVEEVEC
jgi:4'-phosphopantetheinyl transferase